MAIKSALKSVTPSCAKAMTGISLLAMALPVSAAPLHYTNGSPAKWVLVPKDGVQDCILRTQIQGAGRLNQLDVYRSIGGRILSWTFKGPATRKRWSEMTATYVIGHRSKREQQLNEYDWEGSRQLTNLSFEDREASAIARGEPVKLTLETGDVISIDTAGLAALSAAADQCDRDLLVQLGADPNLVRQMAIEPSADVKSLFSTNDYPVEALRKEEQGITTALVVVAPSGAVEDCRISESSKSEALDRATCNVLSRRKIEPGRDASGRKVRSPKSLRVRWALPDSPLEAGFVRAVFKLSEANAAKDCTIESSNAVPPDCGPWRFVKQQFLSQTDRPVADELIVETGTRLGKGDELLSLGKTPGWLVLTLAGYTMTIGTDGKVIDCKPSFPRPDEDAIRARCDGARQTHYEPFDAESEPGPRLLTSYFAIYLRGAATPPRLTNLPLLFSSDDYPADALAAGREGTTTVKVTVESDGRAGNCEVLVSAGLASLDNEACKNIMAGGKFEAGRDPQGRPHRAATVRRVRWELPVSPIRDSFSRVMVKLKPDGSVGDCSIEGENDDDMTCESAIEESGLALKSALAGKKGTLIVEVGELIGTGDSVEHLGSGRGQSLWYLSAVTLEIDSDGKVVGCVPTFDWMKDEHTVSSCDSGRADKFAPLNAKDTNRSSRFFTRYEVIYFQN